MHSTSLESVHPKGAGKHVAALLRLDEDKNTILPGKILAEVAEEVAVLVLIRANLHHLCHILVTSEVERTDGNLIVVTKVVTSEVLNIARPCRRPHQNLSVWPNLGANLAKLRLESHVQHSICTQKKEREREREREREQYIVRNKVNERTQYDIEAQQDEFSPASSRTKYVTRFKLVLPCSRWSMSRPGVAITISIPDLKSRI
jgi:hypothetical protein